MNPQALSDEDLYTAMLALTQTLATRSSQDWEADRRLLTEVIAELEDRGYQID